MRTCLEGEDVLAGLDSFKNLFVGEEVVLGLGEELGGQGLVGMVGVRVRGWVVHVVCECPHKDGSAGMCGCL